MRKSIFWLLLFLLPTYVFAQHDHGSNGGGHSGGAVRGGGNPGRSQVRNGVRPGRSQVRSGNNPGRERGERGGGRRNGEVRGERGRERERGVVRHWDGHRFDPRWFRDHYGREHRFFWRRCQWYGSPFYVGSYFWFGDTWFVIMEPIPDYWYDGIVYVDEIDGVYYVVNPAYPGMRFLVVVRLP